MPRRAFTLIELLVVVAIIAILAAIALPNFLEAQTRAKVSRVKADLRSLATGMEAYAVDWNTYPGDGVGPNYSGFTGLTTPTAYLTSIFKDVFNNGHVDGRTGAMGGSDDQNELRSYEMGTGNWESPAIEFPSRVWAMAAYGPDRDDDTHLIGRFPFTNEATPYDSTNGTISTGDIYRLGPRDWHPNFVTDANPVAF